MRYASFGTVSHGTMRNEDLLDSFADELEYHTQRNAAELNHVTDGYTTAESFLKLAAEARDIDPDCDEASDIIEELFNALETFAPPYAYFGAHQGDGSDYGFWLSDDAIEFFDGLKVDDTSEVPNTYSGEVLHVNDHGNVTLYVADKGKLTEVWGLV